MCDCCELKTLVEKLSLKGTEETISITELRSRPGDILTQVEMGASFKIERNGRLIAVLSGPEPSALDLGRAARKAGIVK